MGYVQGLDSVGRDDPTPTGRNDATDASVSDPVGLDPAALTHPASPPLRRLLLAADLLAVVIGWTAALGVAVLAGEVDFGWVTVTAQTLFIAVGGLLVLSAAGLYRRSICSIRSQEVARIGRSSLALAAMTVITLASVGREGAVLAGFVGGITWFVLLSIERGLFREWIQGRRASGDFGAPVVVVAASLQAAEAAAAIMIENPFLGFEVRRLVSPPPDPDEGLAWFNAPDGLFGHLREARASGVVLDAGSLDEPQLTGMVQALTVTGLHVHISSGLRGVDRRRITVAPVADETFLHVAPLGLTQRQKLAKRLLDVVLAGVAMVLFLPVLVPAMLAVWLQDRGPVLFRQERVGHEGERFTVYKLRTMVIDAESRRAEYEGDNGRSGPLFKLARDPRVTRVGRFLRASSIDELPQLWNVLEGTMSLVGPRPALPDEVEQFDDKLNERLNVKPGVTGLWQVEARDLANFDLYRRYDLLYVQNWSLGLDLAIVGRTIAVVGLRAVRAVLPRRSRDEVIVLD